MKVNLQPNSPKELAKLLCTLGHYFENTRRMVVMYQVVASEG